MAKYIDTHIHLDAYKPEEQQLIVSELSMYNVDLVITVSMHMASCLRNQALHRAHPDLVKPAYGFHPEQPVPSEDELARLLDWIRDHAHEAVAIGEVGLPYYLRTEAEANGMANGVPNDVAFDLAPYIELLEQFVMMAAELNKPLALHAVYDDADIACDLLEKHSIERAHFHWFKGSEQTIERIVANGYVISFTPDIVYDREIQQVAAQVPLEHMLAETDGSWQHEGPYAGQMTHPRMVADVVRQIAALKNVSEEHAIQTILSTTRRFYR